jgi:hypothetical protein
MAQAKRTKHVAKSTRGARASKRAEATDRPAKKTDTSTTDSVGSYTNEMNAEVVDVVCPNGHSSGKGQVATGYLGRATCGQCGDKLVAARQSADTKAKNKKGGNLIDALEPLNMPGLPKHSPNPDFVSKKTEERRKARAAEPKMDAKGGEGVTVARDPSA